MEWLIPCAFLLVLAACGKEETERQDTPPPRTYGTFALSLDSTEQVVDSISIDLNADGVNECLITVGPRMADTSLPKMISLLHVFEFSTIDSAWNSIFVDAVESGEVLYFRDVTGSGAPEVIVETNAGGNDPISSRGVHVYGFRADNVFTLLFYSPSGKPEFTDLNSDGVDEILVLGEYWGVMSRADAFVYTDGVYAFDGNAYRDARAESAGYYRRVIAEQLRMYNASQSKPEDVDDLYRAAMDVMLWYAASGDTGSMKAFWNKERRALERSLPHELYDELEYFVDMEQTGYTQPSAGGQS